MLQAASAIPDPYVQKRSESVNELEQVNKKQNVVKTLSSEELLKSTTVPLWNVPYETQVNICLHSVIIYNTVFYGFSVKISLT